MSFTLWWAAALASFPCAVVATAGSTSKPPNPIPIHQAQTQNFSIFPSAYLRFHLLEDGYVDDVFADDADASMRRKKGGKLLSEGMLDAADYVLHSSLILSLTLQHSFSH